MSQEAIPATNGAPIARPCWSYIEEVASRYPDEIAIISVQHRLTYQDVERRSRAIAIELARRSLGIEARIALFCDMSADNIVAMIGILRAGAAVVPVDTNEPRERVMDTLTMAGVSAAIGNVEPGWYGGLKVVDVDEARTSGVIALRERYVAPRVERESAAAVLFTTGSAGVRKAVVRTHESIVDRIQWMPMCEDDVLCHNLPLSVGMSHERVLVPLMRGRTVVVASDDAIHDASRLGQIIEIFGVTQITIVPRMLREILQLPTHGRNTFRSVRLFASGGDSLSAADVAAFAKAFPDARLENAYGTTEAGSAIRGDPRVDAALVSIGRPVGKTVAFVVNDGLQKCACGEPGELAIGGPGIARGYVEDAALTADRFRPDPFSGHPGARLYLTGDKCRALPDGRFVHLGRLDRQTMINGARVEPAEVEATIGASGTVRDVVVVPRMLASRPRLVAYVVPRERWDDGPRELLHQRLVATLPSYMRPALIVALSAMPYRANGKPDLTRLPWPVKSSDCIDNGNDREGGGILAIVVEEVQNVLDIARVEVSANFFENGGDSISAVRLSNAFEARLGIRESIDGILESGSIRALSDRVEQKIGARRRVGEIEDGSPPEGQLDSPASGATAGEQTGDNDVLSMQEEGLLRGELRYWGGVQPQGQSQVRLGLEFRGRIELTHLETCINTVIAWHDLLMTAYTPTYQNGAWIKRGWREVGILISQDPQLAGDVRFVKEVRRHRRLTLPLIEVIGDAGEGRSTIHRVTQSLIGARFNYSNPPLVLVCAIRASPSQANLIIIMPHIVSDGWSIRRFAEQVMRLYDGGVLEGRLEPNRRATYVDFARHQRLHAAATMRAVRAGAFDSERCDALQIQAIVEGSGRTFGGNHNTKRLRVISLSPSVANSMRELTTRERVTPFMCVVAAFAVVLGRRSRRGRVGVRTVHANRIKAEYEDVIGFFASGQIICVDLSRSPSLAAICKRVRKEVSSVMSRGAVVLANPFGDTNDPHYGVEVRMDDRPLRIWGQECNARSFRVAPGDDGECALRLVVRDESLTTLALEYCPGCIRGSDVMEISEDIGRVMDSDVNTPIHGLCCEP